MPLTAFGGGCYAKIGFGCSIVKKQGAADGIVEFRRQKTLLKTGTLQDVVFNRAYFSSIPSEANRLDQAS